MPIDPKEIARDYDALMVDHPTVKQSLTVQPPSGAREPEVFELGYLPGSIGSRLHCNSVLASVGSSWVSKHDYDTLSDRLRVAETERDGLRIELDGVLETYNVAMARNDQLNSTIEALHTTNARLARAVEKVRALPRYDAELRYDEWGSNASHIEGVMIANGDYFQAPDVLAALAEVAG